MHLDPRLDEMRPHRALGDLKFQRAVGDAIVVADLPLFLDAQDLVEVDARNGGEGRTFAGRIDRETRVVGGQIAVADEGVGRRDIGYAGEPSSFAAGPEACRTCVPIGRWPAANRLRYARRPDCAAAARPGSDGPDRSRRQLSGCESNAPRDQCRGSSAGHAAENLFQPLKVEAVPSSSTRKAE